MNNEIQFLEVDNKKIPMLFSLNVMEQIQNKYGSMDAWGKEMQPEDDSEPKITTIIDTFYFAINEGIEEMNYQNKTNEPLYDRKQIGRLITKLGLDKARRQMVGLVVDSTKTDEEEKNL